MTEPTPPNNEEPTMPDPMSPEDTDDLQVARITIRRSLTDEALVDYVEAVDSDGEDLPLTEALGMLRLAEDTLIRERMSDDGEDA